MATTTITRENVEAKVIEAISELGPDPAAVTPDATFEALDVDSLDLVELGQIVQEEYGVEIKGEDMPGLKTVADAVTLIESRIGR